MRRLHSVPVERPRPLPKLSLGVLRTLQYWLSHGQTEFLTLHILPNSARVYLPDGTNARQAISDRDFSMFTDPWIYQSHITEFDRYNFKGKVKVVWRT